MIRTLSYCVDIDTGKLLDSETWYPLNETPWAKRGDTIQVELNFKKLSTTNPRAYTDATLTAATGSWFVGLKKRLEWDATAFLAQTEVATLDTAQLTFELDLTSSALVTALSGNAASVECGFEVEHTDANGRDTLAAFRFDILNDYIKGTEGDPAPSTPEYYTAAQVQALIASIISVPEGMRIRATAEGNIIVEEIET